MAFRYDKIPKPFSRINNFAVFALPADCAADTEKDLSRGRYLYYKDKQNNIIIVFNLSINDATAIAADYCVKQFCFCTAENRALKTTLWGTRGPLRLNIKDGKTVLAPQAPDARGRRPVALAEDIDLSGEKAEEAFDALFNFFDISLSFSSFVPFVREAERVIYENQKTNRQSDEELNELLRISFDNNSTGWRRYTARKVKRAL